MKRQFIECGKIVSTHGIRGELKMQPWTNNPEHLLSFPTLYLDKGDRPLAVTAGRIHKNMLLLTVEGVDTLDKANNYRGQLVYLDRADDPDDAPYLIDFIGLAVLDADSGKPYGTIIQVIRTGANDVYQLKDEQGVERLVPDIPQVILDTDFLTKQMKIRPLKGLFEDAD